MAALTLRTQTTGLRPEFEHVVTRRRRSVQTEREALSPRGRQINEHSLDRFRLEWKEADAGQRFLLVNAFKDAHGRAMPMNYTPLGDIDANAIEVRFVEDSLSIKGSGPLSFAMTVEIEEAR